MNAAGNLQGAALAPIARMPSNAGLVGTTDWRGSLDVERNADARQPARGTVELSSDLRGLASALPEPFAKTAEASRPLALSASFDGRAGPRIEGSLRARRARAPASGAAAPARRPSSAASSSSAARPPSALPKNPGLWLTGRVESASLTRLLDLKWDGPRGRPIQEWLGGADLAVGRFEAVGYEFANVSGRLRPGNRAWDVTVTGDAIAGRVVVPFTLPGRSADGARPRRGCTSAPARPASASVPIPTRASCRRSA